jgi:hypothetical protein
VLRHGLVYPSGGIEWVPLGIFRTDSASGSLLDDQPVTVAGTSREAWLIDDNRSAGMYTTTGGMASSLIRARILATASAAAVKIGTRRDRVVPASSADDADAWATVERLARSIGAVAYVDPDGVFTVASQPTKASKPSARIPAGLGGVLLTATSGGSRDDVVVGVAVSWTAPDGTQRRTLVTNTDPSSPTRQGDPSTGAFGRGPILELSDSSITSDAAARTMATAELAKRTGVASQMSLTAIPLPFLDALDVVDIVTDPTAPVLSLRRHVVDSFTWDLAAGGTFSAQTRDLGQVVV